MKAVASRIPSRFLPGIAALTVAAVTCFAAATVVDAQTPPPGAGMRDGRGPDMHEQHGPAMRMMRELDRLKASLQLNPQQAALWDRAAAAMKPDGNPRDEMKARHDRMLAMLADPNFNPRALAAETDRMADEHMAKMRTVREAWFSVYDSLNAAQRGQVREFLRERMAKRDHGMHEGGWMHRGEQGKPPMPPGAPGAPTR